MILFVGFVAFVVLYAIARGYADVRTQLLGAMLVISVLALALTIGTLTGLRNVPEFTTGRTWGLVGIGITEALGLLDTYFLLHPDWTSGSYEQAFSRFVESGSSFSSAMGSQWKATVFIGYQGFGAFTAFATLTVGVILVLGISGTVESEAGLRIGLLRRASRWMFQRMGGGFVTPILLFAGILCTALCSGVAYNVLPLSGFTIGSAPPKVQSLVVKQDHGRVRVAFSLRQAATIRIAIGPVHKKRRDYLTAQYDHRLPAGNHSLSLSLPGNRARSAASLHLYRIVVFAQNAHDQSATVSRVFRFRRRARGG